MNRCETWYNSCQPAMNSDGDEWCVNPWDGSTELYMFSKCPKSCGDPTTGITCAMDSDCMDCYDDMNGWTSYKCMKGRCYQGKYDAGRCPMEGNHCDPAMMSNGDEWCVYPWNDAPDLYLFRKCPASCGTETGGKICGIDSDCMDCYDMMAGWTSYKCMKNRCYRGKYDDGRCAVTASSCDPAMMSNGDEWCVHPWDGAAELHYFQKCPATCGGTTVGAPGVMCGDNMACFD